MVHSQSYTQFLSSLGMTEALLDIEKTYVDPPQNIYTQKAVEGLRSGAVILMVANFESFLKNAIIEHLTKLIIPIPINYDKLPPKMRMNCVFLPLEKAMNVRNTQRNRLPLTPSVEEVCKNITDHVIDPTIFNNTKSNPNSQTVKSLFNEIGKDDIFWHIKDDFDKEWPVATHSRFVPEKL